MIFFSKDCLELILVVSVFNFAGTTHGHYVKGSSYCEFYNETLCPEYSVECSERQECGPQEPDKRNHCYVLWKFDSEKKTNKIILKVNKCFVFAKTVCFAKIVCFVKKKCSIQFVFILFPLFIYIYSM